MSLPATRARAGSQSTALAGGSGLQRWGPAPAVLGGCGGADIAHTGVRITIARKSRSRRIRHLQCAAARARLGKAPQPTGMMDPGVGERNSACVPAHMVVSLTTVKAQAAAARTCWLHAWY